MARGPGGYKRACFGLLTALLASVLALLPGEVVVRIFIPQEDSVQWVASSEKYGHVIKKGFSQDYRFPSAGFTMQVRTNSLGMRDDEPDLESKNIKRVLFLGDSFVFGHGVNVEDRFDTLLDGFLKKTGGAKYELINAGVTGWGTLQETAYARDNLELLKPDIIVLTYCGNDPLDDVRFTHGMSDDERGLYYFPGKIFLKDNSHLFRLVYLKASRLLYNRIITKRIGKIEKKVGKLSVAGNGGDTTVDEQSGSVITDDEWMRSLGEIRKFQADFKRYNPEGVLIVQATAPWNEGIRQRLRGLEDGGANGIIYADMFNETFGLSSDDRNLPFDGHWSPKLHLISAIKLAAVIGSLDKEGAKRKD